MSTHINVHMINFMVALLTMKITYRKNFQVYTGMQIYWSQLCESTHPPLACSTTPAAYMCRLLHNPGILAIVETEEWHNNHRGKSPR